MSDVATNSVPLQRHPVKRTGEREPIDPHKRMLIYERDHYTCQWCGFRVAPWDRRKQIERDPFHVDSLQLDHVVPWSALGSDRSDNLRTLCGPCNEQRSNYVDPFPPRLIGVTRACYWCAVRRRELPEALEDLPVAALDRINTYCGCCGTASWVPAENWIL